MVTSLNEKPRILINSADNGAHWLLIQPTGHKSNRDADRRENQIDHAFGPHTLQSRDYQRRLSFLQRPPGALRSGAGAVGRFDRSSLA